MHHFYVMEKKHLLFYLRSPVFMVPMALTEREEAPASDFPSPRPPLKRMAEASGHPTGRTAFYSG